MDTSGANVALPDTNVALNMDTPEANMALNMDTSIPNMALPKRYTKEKLREKLIEVCSTWLTAEEIALRIGRDTKYVKNFILPQMSDVLEKMYDVPHHPRQKYRIKK